MQKDNTDDKSDIDIAIIVKNKTGKQRIEKIFIDEISGKFHDYFGIHLDSYIKTKEEFMRLFKKNLPPVSTLIKSYSIIYGLDLLELK